MLLLVATCVVAFVLLLYMLSPLISPKPLALPGAHVVVSGSQCARPSPGRLGRPFPKRGSPAAVHPGTVPTEGLWDLSCPLRLLAPPGGSFGVSRAARPSQVHPWVAAVFVLSLPNESPEEERLRNFVKDTAVDDGAGR